MSLKVENDFYKFKVNLKKKTVEKHATEVYIVNFEHIFSHHAYFFIVTAQPGFTFSKSTMETSEQCSKLTKNTPVTLFWYPIVNFEEISHMFWYFNC